jgi:hypothetical protein
MRLIVLLLTALCAGCSGPRVQVIQPPPTQQPLVWIRGDVKNPAVPWNDQLTLARAIVAAEYKGLWDPHVIMIIRQGQTYRVKPRDLLSGRDDPALEPGDTVVIER